MSKRKGYMRITKRMKSKKGNCYIGAVNDGIEWPDSKQIFKGKCPRCGCEMTYEDWMEWGCPNCKPEEDIDDEFIDKHRD